MINQEAVVPPGSNRRHQEVYSINKMSKIVTTHLTYQLTGIAQQLQCFLQTYVFCFHSLPQEPITFLPLCFVGHAGVKAERSHHYDLIHNWWNNNQPLEE
jgi:hypothetical protein